MNGLMRSAGISRSGIARCLTAVIGVSSIAWAVSAISCYRSEAAFTDPAQRILIGDKYSAAQLGKLRTLVDAARGRPLRPSALSNVAIIRLRIAEAERASGETPASEASLDDLAVALDAALAAMPTNSFLWLADYWLQGIRSGSRERGIDLLRMSYLSGPNEAWIASKRNALALSIFPSLPGDLAEMAPAEFAGLVRSGLYDEAATILAGPGWAVRDRLMRSLAQLDEDDRRRFARVLEARKLDGAMVPGLSQ